MSPLSRSALFLGLCMLAPSAAWAEKLVGPNSVTFLATGPGGLKIEGKTAALEVKEADGKVTFTVPLAGLDTGIELRNKHMKEKYLEVGKFPTATLVVERATVKPPADGANIAATAPGTLTIHGQTKPATVQYTAKKEQGVYAATGTLNIKLADFGIEVPNYMGITVKQDVEIKVTFKVSEK